MAGDWIKVRKDLTHDPAVIRLATACGLDLFGCVGRLIAFWSWADSHTATGQIPGVSPEWLDREVFRTPGYAAALVEVGWLVVRGGGLELPNFDRHLGESAKARAGEAIRKRITRTAANVSGQMSGKCPDQRREEKKKDPPTPQRGDGAGADPPRRRKPKAGPDDPRFAAFWGAYPRKEAKVKAEQAWAKLRPDDELLAVMLAALEVQRRWPKWAKDNGEYIPHPATWLNQRRWEDSPPVSGQMSGQSSGHGERDYARETLEAMERRRAAEAANPGKPWDWLSNRKQE